jgi:hypothetical protein
MSTLAMLFAIQALLGTARSPWHAPVYLVLPGAPLGS